MNDEQIALLRRLGLPSNILSLSEDEYWVVYEAMSAELWQRGINETRKDLNAYGELCKSIFLLLFHDKDSATEQYFELLAAGAVSQSDKLCCPDCGAPISYRYTASCEYFTVWCGCSIIRAIKCDDPPGCVTFFGSEHTF